MAVRGVYPEPIARMVAETKKAQDEAVGWIKPKGPQVATADAMKKFGFLVDYRNPFYYDENHANGSKWGSLVGLPLFLSSLAETRVGPIETPECGVVAWLWPGEDWEFFKPVRPGDSFKIWARRPSMEDVTPLDGKGPHTFRTVRSDCDYINQKDELVATLRYFAYRAYYPAEVPPAVPMPFYWYGYTKEELNHLDKYVRQEEVRGVRPRYWEDVKVGDDTAPVVTGPTYMGDNALVGAMTVGPKMGGPLPPQELIHEDPKLGLVGDFVKLDSGLYYRKGGGAGRHFSDYSSQSESEPCAFLFGVVSIYTMERVVCRWMGDDGFLKSFHWRHIWRTPVGDAMVGKGKIINKRIENGEHLVDLKVWLENNRGCISETCLATVALPSKDAPYKWK